jgi:hypothetical protein
MSTGHYINRPTTETVWEENEVGLLVAVEKPIEKREKMRRFEWKAVMAEEEITLEQYLEECKTYIHLPHGHM